MLKVTVVFVAFLGAVGCSNTDGDSAGLEGQAELTLTLANVPPLGPDFIYEGWIVVAGGPIPTGRFTVDDSGAMNPATHMVDAQDLAAADTFVLTIEPAVGDDPAPADTHLLAGALVDEVADLTLAHGAALGTDFSDAAGDYVLATPSTAADTADNNQGIWWLLPGMPPAAALTLPTLPAGWAYEGWVVGLEGPASTGRFLTAAETDSDGAGDTAGPDGFPPFPGQDFIDPARLLDDGDHAAVITVEPEPDNDPSPFILKPLVDPTIDATTFPATQSMANQSSSARPTGTATFTVL